MKNRGLSENTLKIVSYRLKVLSEHCDLDNPEDVNRFIASMKGSNNYKRTFVLSYGYYVRHYGIQWNRPTYEKDSRLPKIPTKEAIMSIIASASKKYATIFRMIMETGIMPYELENLSIENIDFEKGIVYVKGYKKHRSRCFKVSSELIAMLKWYFNRYDSFPKSRTINKAWQYHRNRITEKLQDVTLKNIRLYDLRHYYATMLYHKTKDILLIKQQMGHSRLETTLIYTQLVNFNEEDEFYSATAKTVQEAQKLVENGFEYVCDIEDVKLFRKRK
jgi:integrase/recombinase XerD